MKVIWEVVDGYVGPSRPHVTEIEDEDLDECQSEREREDYIRDAIADDFEREVSYREISRK